MQQVHDFFSKLQASQCCCHNEMMMLHGVAKGKSSKYMNPYNR